MGSRRLPHGSVVSGKYRLLERLGGGGMGDVYRAEHTLAGRVVAFKLLREDFAEDADVTARFFQEAQAVNRIRHPNIVDVLDAGFSEQGPYVVMEILEGASVAAALERLGRFALEGALAVVLPVLDALDAAHRHGIVHRDLKPENVFLAKDGEEVRVKILDFGIAKVLDEPEATSRPRTHTGIIFGTPDYLSPEQASGDRVVDGRSDIFAAGTVLFELLTGRRPFQAKTAVATAYKVVHEAAPRLVDLGYAFEPVVQTALDVALAKQPEERFANAAAFADMLAPVVPDGPTRRAALRALLDAAVAPVSDAARSGVPVASSLPPASRAPASFPSSSPRPPVSAPPASAPATPTLASRPELTPSRPPVLTPRPPSLRVPEAPPRSGPASRRPPASWVPRPLPSHVKGRCHVRGSLSRAVMHWVERGHGAAACDGVLALLPAEYADYFRADAFNALVWYELEPLDMFVEATTATLLRGEAAAWRTLAREHEEHDLSSLFRPVHRTFDPLTVLRRSPAAWRKIFDFGTMYVHEVPSAEGVRVAVNVDGFEGTSLALRYAVIGVMEGLVVHSGVSETEVRIEAGASSFARELSFELGWRA